MPRRQLAWSPLKLSPKITNRISTFQHVSQIPLTESPRSPQFQYLGFCSDGDAFQSFNPDFLLARVPEAEKLPNTLKADTSAVEVTEHKDSIFKLELTYQPDKVIIRSKADREEFSMPKSSYAAQLLSYLIAIEGPRTLTLCGPYRFS